MRWEELTSDDFPQAIKDAEDVCLIPLSVIERHAHHLPMGTDMYIARELCRRTAKLEPAVIFPDYIFTQIFEAREHPGTIAIDSDLMMRMLDNICREIARNGMKKIVFINAHGGNTNFFRYFAQLQLESPRDYVVYIADPNLLPEDEAAVMGLWQPGEDGHAGAGETAMIQVIRPDLVHTDRIKANGEGDSLDRLKHLTSLGVNVGISWYADHPTHYSGYGGAATPEKGEILLAALARAFARAIRAIKDDSETLRLQNEFFASWRS